MSDSGTESGAISDVIAIAPPVVLVDGKSLRIVDVTVRETVNSSMRFASVNWATADSPQTKREAQPTETNDHEQSFSIGGGTQRVQEALSQLKYPAAAPDLGNAVNVQEDGSVEGVDILVPTLSFRRTYYLPTSVVTDSYARGLRDAVGKTNNASFLNFDVGELLLLSANGTQRGQADWAVSFEWLAGKNQSDLAVAGIEDINKGAHEFLWILYEQEQEDTAKKMKPVVIGVYVAVVYGQVHYPTILGIPGADPPEDE